MCVYDLFAVAAILVGRNAREEVWRLRASDPESIQTLERLQTVHSTPQWRSVQLLLLPAVTTLEMLEILWNTFVPLGNVNSSGAANTAEVTLNFINNLVVVITINFCGFDYHVLMSAHVFSWCDMVHWSRWVWSLILTTNWLSWLLSHCWLGSLTCENRSRNDITWDDKPLLTHSRC